MAREADNIVSRYKAINEGFLDGVATGYIARGEGTGATSKVLSQLWLLVLTFLAIQLVKDGQFVLLLILATLSWTRLGWLVMPGALIYLIASKYWIAAASVGISIIVMSLSSCFGWQSVKNLLRGGKPMISPFEGMPDLLVIMVLECAFFAVALLTRGWISFVFWILFALVLLHHSLRLIFRMRPRWRQIHNPLMIRYARAAAEESVRSDAEKRRFDFCQAAAKLLDSVYPNRQEDEIKEMVDFANDKRQSFADRSLIRDTIVARNSTLSPEHCDEALDEIDRYLQTEESRRLIIRYAIAEVVEDLFGQSERGNYLAAVFAGEAT